MTAPGHIVRFASTFAAIGLMACGGSLTFDSDADEDSGSDTSVDTNTDNPGDAPDDTPGDSPADTVTDGDAIVDVPPDGTELLDEDGDTISDWHEGLGDVDTDGDTIADMEDTDSDGDGLLDADEAGDDDLDTPPDDCDSDGVPNFRDLDSDDDGIRDANEASHGTDVCNADSDGDGVEDLAEIAYGSDPTDGEDSPTNNGDFVFLVPYNDDPRPAVDTLVFSTSLLMADVFFLMDTTGSMSHEIDSLQADLSDVIIPGIRAVVPDSVFGVGRFDDYPVSPYGSPTTDVIFQLMQPMTADPTTAQAAVDALTLHSGSDGPEGHIPALWAIATGSGLGGYLADAPPCPGSSFGYPCFRPRSVPIVVLITDAGMHNGPTDTPGVYANPYDPDDLSSHVPPNYDDAVTALTAINAKVIPVWSDGGFGDVEDHVTRIAEDTGAVDGTGSPLVYNVDSTGTGLGANVSTAVETLATGTPIRVDAIAMDNPSDMVDAVAEFIELIESNTSGAAIWDPILLEMRECTSGIPTAAGGTAPTVDYFEVVEPGVSVCFDIVPATNTSIPSTSVPVVFTATIDVLGDEFTPLDSREIFFVVPPTS